MNEAILDIMRDVANEVTDATLKHKPYNSAHEAYGVLMEEVEEFFDEVKLKRELRNKANMRKELLQVAACAIRAVHDLGL